MSAKSVVRKGDITDHGGVVINGFDSFTYEETLVGVGHMVAFPGILWSPLATDSLWRNFGNWN